MALGTRHYNPDFTSLHCWTGDGGGKSPKIIKGRCKAISLSWKLTESFTSMSLYHRKENINKLSFGNEWPLHSSNKSKTPRNPFRWKMPYKGMIVSNDFQLQGHCLVMSHRKTEERIRIFVNKVCNSILGLLLICKSKHL